MVRPYTVVDVFTDQPYRGNPLAVVLDADGLTTEEMQRFAAWTNLSETSFVLAPTDPRADYRVRIFTPVTELPFAGHPTLGTCHAWLRHGGNPSSSDRIVQECGIGLVEVTGGADGSLAFAAPPLLRDGPPDASTLATVTAALGLDPADVLDARWIDNGPGWLGVLLADADRVLALRLPGPSDEEPSMLGVVGLYPPGGPSAYEVRAFDLQGGTAVEDPVTGSLHASVAQWLVSTGTVRPPYTATQGSVLGRAGRVSVSSDTVGRLWVGGIVTTCVSGTVVL